MDGNSRSVTSPQQGPHARLEETVRRHMRAPWRRPMAAHTREAFAALDEQIDRSRPLILDAGCGTGASSRTLARRHPGAQVIGIDKSAARLARAVVEEGTCAPVPWLVRADLQDFWRLALAADWRPSHQYLLYPNPWPKPSGFGQRWHGHPVLPVILALGGRIELRSNWELYVREFALALEIWGIDSRIDVLERIPEEGALTPFERKYLASGQRCWRLLAEPGAAVDRKRVLKRDAMEAKAMDWNRYRQICDQGDVLSRWLLMRTAGLLRRDGETSLADWLEWHLEHEPVSKPDDHLGGAETDFFRVTPDLARVQRIVDHVARAAADPERRLRGGRGFGGVTEAWTEFRDWLDGSHPRSPHRPG